MLDEKKELISIFIEDAKKTHKALNNNKNAALQTVQAFKSFKLYLDTLKDAIWENLSEESKAVFLDYEKAIVSMDKKSLDKKLSAFEKYVKETFGKIDLYNSSDYYSSDKLDFEDFALDKPNNIKIVYINGGLGNQVFQYIFARWLQLSGHKDVYLDDSYFFLTQEIAEQNKKEQPAYNISGAHNGYELDYVFPNHTKIRRLSEYLSKEDLNKGINWICSKINNIKVIFEAYGNFDLMNSVVASEKYMSDSNQYNSMVGKLDGNVYYGGYWINPGWIRAYNNVILKDLEFRLIQKTDIHNKNYEKLIKNKFSVGVHIRRGDFIKLGWEVNEETYKNILQNIQDNISGTADYFIFSDQIDWVIENADKLNIPDHAIYVTGNFDYQNNYIDCYLMSQCNVLVVGVSSFSYLASLLNQRPGFIKTFARDSLTGEDISKPLVSLD